MKKLILIVLFFLTACTTPGAPKNILLVSTTSTQDSGLLDVLLPAFTEQTGYQVSLVATGSGQALKIAEEGNADVILLHSPAAEKEFMDKRLGTNRRLVMHNDFIIVGPESDPAALRTQPKAVDAFNAIFSSSSVFVSRGDESGTHVKELAIWKKSNLDLTGQSWYIETGQGQGTTLNIASEKQGYALTDRGTFLAYKKNLDLVILFENDPILLNVYHVITVNSEKWPNTNIEGAKSFSDFVTSEKGQKIIREFGLDQYGQPLFYPDADKTDAELGNP